MDPYVHRPLSASLLVLALAVPAAGELVELQQLDTPVTFRHAPSAPIYHGQSTLAHPAVVAVGIFNRDGSSGLCSGTLIAPRIVLTAGHCFGFDPIGASILALPDGVTEVVYDGVAYAVHPQFSLAVAAVADVAILVLERTVADVVPLPLASASPRPRTVGTIVGFGDDGFGGFGVKLEGRIRVRRCPKTLKGARLVKGQLDGSVCWRPKQRLQDTCQGDSGGPLLVGGQVAGITSGGFPACPGRVSWDTDVALFRPWIEGAIAAAEEEVP